MAPTIPQARFNDLETLVGSEGKFIGGIQDRIQQTYRANTTNGKLNAGVTPEKLGEALYAATVDEYWNKYFGRPPATATPGNIWAQRDEAEHQRNAMAPFFGNDFSPGKFVDMFGGPDGTSVVSAEEVASMKQYVGTAMKKRIGKDVQGGTAEILMDKDRAKEAADTIARVIGLAPDKVFTAINIKDGMNNDQIQKAFEEFGKLFGLYSNLKGIGHYK